jgi:hypothetical protein
MAADERKPTDKLDDATLAAIGELLEAVELVASSKYRKVAMALGAILATRAKKLARREFPAARATDQELEWLRSLPDMEDDKEVSDGSRRRD